MTLGLTKEMYLKICFVILPLVLSSCVVAPTLSEDPEESKLLSKIERHQKGTAHHIELMNYYIKRYNENKDSIDRDNAFDQAKLILKDDPQNSSVQLLAYELLSNKVLADLNMGSMDELSALYRQYPTYKLSNVQPPSFIRALLAIRLRDRNIEMSRIKGYLKEAIREKPDFLGSSLLLSNIFKREERYDLAIAVLENTHSDHQSNPKRHKYLGNLYRITGHLGFCGENSSSLLKKAVKSYKLALADNKSNPEIHSKLASSYKLLGRSGLFLHEARKFSELNNDTEGEEKLAEAMYWDGRSVNAEKVLKSVLDQEPDNLNANQMLARLYFSTQQWQESINQWKQYRKHRDEPYFYGVLIESLALAKLEGREAATLMLQKLAGGLKLDAWEKAIYQFHMGEISMDSFNKTAADACQQTEAYFYSGFQLWSGNDSTGAKDYFNKTVDVGVFAYNEFVSAKYYLSTLD